MRRCSGNDRLSVRLPQKPVKAYVLPTIQHLHHAVTWQFEQEAFTPTMHRVISLMDMLFFRQIWTVSQSYYSINSFPFGDEFHLLTKVEKHKFI